MLECLAPNVITDDCGCESAILYVFGHLTSLNHGVVAVISPLWESGHEGTISNTVRSTIIDY